MEEKIKPRKISILMLAVCLIALAYMVSILFDSFNDMAVCKNEFQAIIGIIPDSAFANNDYWVLNFGKDINCDVFWYEGSHFNFIAFKSGALTLEKYLESKI